MKIKIIGEYGYDQALYGLGLSYGITSDVTFDEYLLDIPLKYRLHEISLKLCRNDGGHNKFLESIAIWLNIRAPRFLFSEIDTYRVGSSKQSESTIHTLMKTPIEQSMFESDIMESTIENLEKLRKENDFIGLKNNLPEAFLQRRIWILNYKSLRNIISQRRKHKLEQWRQFCSYIIQNSEHKEYFTDLIN